MSCLMYLFFAALIFLSVTRISTSANAELADYDQIDDRLLSGTTLATILEHLEKMIGSHMTLQTSAMNAKVDIIMDSVKKLQEQNKLANSILSHSVSKIEERLTVLNWKIDKLDHSITQMENKSSHRDLNLQNVTELVDGRTNCLALFSELTESVQKLELAQSAHDVSMSDKIAEVIDFHKGILTTLDSKVTAIYKSSKELELQEPGVSHKANVTQSQQYAQNKGTVAMGEVSILQGYLERISNAVDTLVPITAEYQTSTENILNRLDEIANSTEILGSKNTLSQNKLIQDQKTSNEFSATNFAILGGFLQNMMKKQDQTTNILSSFKLNFKSQFEKENTTTTTPVPVPIQPTPIATATAPCTFPLHHEFVKGYACVAPNKGRFIFQEDGNFVVYDESGKPKWNSRTAGSVGAKGIFQGDGNFVIYDCAGKPKFNTNTQGTGYRLVFQGDRNLVIYNNANSPVWNSGSHV